MNTIIEELRVEIRRLIKHNAEHPKDEITADVYEFALEDVLEALDKYEQSHPAPPDAEKAAENSEIIFSTDGELPIYSFVGAPRWWATIREAEEALSLFKTGMLAERERIAAKCAYPNAKKAALIRYPHVTDPKFERDNELRREGFSVGVFAERNRVLRQAADGEVVKDISGKLGVTAKVNLDGFVFGEKVKVFIIKEAKK